MERSRLVRLVTAVVVAVVAAPAALALVGVDHDDFPLSTFPMFARERPATTLLSGAVVMEADGSEDRLGPQTISGSAEPLQAKSLVDRALDGDPTSLCRRLLDRTDGARVLLVEDEVRAVDHYLGDESATRRVRSVECRQVVR
ncbi:MAG: hypothetical protein M3Z03_06645 [Actinomycetota bacterium]|nr:hypothetical protein [Actinomycetota bacterium]